MTVTIKTTKTTKREYKTTKTTKREYEATVLLDILADGKRVGSATLIRNFDENGKTEDDYLERIDIDDEHHGKGYETAAIKALAKKFGRIVAAPDNEDDQRLYERVGENAYYMTYEDRHLAYYDDGFGVYVFS